MLSAQVRAALEPFATVSDFLPQTAITGYPQAVERTSTPDPKHGFLQRKTDSCHPVRGLRLQLAIDLKEPHRPRERLNGHPLQRTSLRQGRRYSDYNRIDGGGTQLATPRREQEPAITAFLPTSIAILYFDGKSWI